MADSTPATSIIEGTVKFRDGKKWKSRWCVMRKLSPVADCVHLQFYKDAKERQRSGQTKASLSLQQYLGFEAGFTLDKESNTLAVLCEDCAPVLAFDTRETLIQWRVKVQHNLGSSKEFAAVLISSPSTAKLSPGPVRLHACGSKLALCGSRPPQVLALWDIKLLRRYGIVEKRLCVEGGSRAGRGAGLFVFAAERARDLTDILNNSQDVHSRMSIGSRCGSVLEKRYSDTSSCLDESFMRASSPCWGAGSQTMHCLSEALEGFEDCGQARRPTSLPRCTSCIGKISSQLSRSSTMTGTPGSIMSPVWTMENIAEKRSECDRASIYSRSSGSASEYSVPRSVLDKSFECKRPSPCCTPAVPAKLAATATAACNCWNKCTCKKKFSGPYENYDVPKTPMPLIQEHPVDVSTDPSSLYDTPKKLKCLLNGASCACPHEEAETGDNSTVQVTCDTSDSNDKDRSLESHSNYVNIIPIEAKVEKKENKQYANYANLDINATLEKFETSLQILKSAGFSQEDLDVLEDIPEHDDDMSTTTSNTVFQNADCCNDHLNYMHMEPLENSSSSNSHKNSDNISHISRISHLSDPTQHSESDNTISTRRSSSADFTKREDEYSYKHLCFTPTVLRKANKNECVHTLSRAKTPECKETKFKLPESKTENSLVARFRDSVKIRRSSSVPSKSDKNRDSSSSNDSGVSTGSLKHHRCDFNEFEMPVTSNKSCQKHMKCVSRNSMTPAHTTFGKSSSSDPLKSLTFQFEEVAALTKASSCDVDTLTRRKKKNGAELSSRNSGITSKSTSSASDTSDYMESLSVSSLSSCEAGAGAGAGAGGERHAARPRSGREYATLHRLHDHV